MVWTRIESIIWSLFTVNVIDYRFRFLQSIPRHSCRSLTGPPVASGDRGALQGPPSFTQYPSPPHSLVRDGQTSPLRPRLVVSYSTCPPLSPSPHANSFVIGTAVINTHTSSTHTAHTHPARKIKNICTAHTHVRDGQTSPLRPRLVVSRSTCPPLSPSLFDLLLYVVAQTVLARSGLPARGVPDGSPTPRAWLPRW